MNKPTQLEHIKHLKKGVKDKCLVCENDLYGQWTDYNGQMRCSHCGTTYQILGSHLKEEFLEKNKLKKEDIAKKYCDCFEDIPLLKAYWNETHQQIPYGTYMGRGPIPKETYDAFYKWVLEHRAELKDWEDDFYWDKMSTN